MMSPFIFHWCDPKQWGCPLCTKNARERKKQRASEIAIWGRLFPKWQKASQEARDKRAGTEAEYRHGWRDPRKMSQRQLEEDWRNHRSRYPEEQRNFQWLVRNMWTIVYNAMGPDQRPYR